MEKITIDQLSKEAKEFRDNNPNNYINTDTLFLATKIVELNNEIVELKDKDK